MCENNFNVGKYSDMKRQELWSRFSTNARGETIKDYYSVYTVIRQTIKIYHSVHTVCEEVFNAVHRAPTQ